MTTDNTTITPEWASAYVDQILDRGPGTYGGSNLTFVERDIDGAPHSFLAATSNGVALGTYSDTEPEISFVPWREVYAIGLDGTDLEVVLKVSAVTFDLGISQDESDDAAERKDLEFARDFASRLILAMPRSAR